MIQDLWHQIAAALPRGNGLPARDWERRHRGMLFVLWAHAAGIFLYVLLRDRDLAHAVVEGGVVSIAGLAASLVDELSRSGAQDLPAIVAVPRDAALVLSFAQQRLWFLAQLDQTSTNYHTPLAWRLEGVLDRTALQRSLDRVLARHEALRSVFVAPKGKPCALAEHRACLEDYFIENPPRSAREAQQAIERLTGIRRGLSQVRAFMKKSWPGLARGRDGPGQGGP